MGRTADSYLQEAGSKQLNTCYPFTEYSDTRLEQELADTWNEQRAVKHGEERTAQLGRRISHLIFELNCRLQEGLEDGRQ